MTPVDKAAVAKALREMSVYLQLKGENQFKTRAYDIAAERIAGLSEDLGELVAEGASPACRASARASATRSPSWSPPGR